MLEIRTNEVSRPKLACSATPMLAGDLFSAEFHRCGFVNADPIPDDVVQLIS